MRVTRTLVGLLWAMGCLVGCGGADLDTNLDGAPVSDGPSAQAQSRCEAGCIARADLCIKRQLKPVAQCVADRDACLAECQYQ